ncbi:unnamed protein product [Hydatigera taeniaeformis]|uniref:Leucine-rich repeat-containing protein 1 n=1 Tax=Hydatigena taeniaeformis TaxID=6205 RepID=A0A0R3WME2_HYDTA|nr:unnamed protein product [Hydatigera taeniaeformis]
MCSVQCKYHGDAGLTKAREILSRQHLVVTRGIERVRSFPDWVSGVLVVQSCWGLAIRSVFFLLLPFCVRVATTKRTGMRDCAKKISRCRDEGKGHLNLSNSQLHALPTSIRDLGAHLCELFLYTNKLVSLPNEIGTLTQLTKLMVQENSLTSLPDSLAECTHLSILDVRHNKLCEIPPVIYRLPNLVLLLLRCNRIRVVDCEIGRLTKLQVLSLRENKIRQLPSIPGICELKQLTTLDVSKNQLEHLPEEIGQCRNLTEISLQNNELTSLPESIGELALLERLGIR